MPLSAYYTAPLWYFENRAEHSFLLENQYPGIYAYAGTVFGFLTVQKGSRVTGLWKVSGNARAPTTPLAWEALRSEKVGGICPFFPTNGFGPEIEVNFTPKLVPCRGVSYGDFSTIFSGFLALFWGVRKWSFLGLFLGFDFFVIILPRKFKKNGKKQLFSYKFYKNESSRTFFYFCSIFHHFSSFFHHFLI